MDGDFVGDAPASIKLSLGKHVILVKASGYQDWERELAVSGGAVNLNAKLAPLVENGPTTAARSASGTLNSPVSSTALATKSQAGSQSTTEPRVGSGWIGVTTKDDPVRGVVVTRVLSGSAASQAGLQVGDVVTELNGRPMKSGMEFDVAISHSVPGSQISIAYVRGALKTEVTVTVGSIQ